jgi:hypothetical protein
VLPPSNQPRPDFRRFRPRVAADEPEDLGKEPKLRLGFSRFPTPNDGLAHPELISDLPLKQAQI